MKGLMDGSDELSVHFKNNIRSYQCFNGCTDCTVDRERSVLLQISWNSEAIRSEFRIQIYHRTSHLHPAVAGGENTNTTHFNNLITHIRHVSRDLRYYSIQPVQRRAIQLVLNKCHLLPPDGVCSQRHTHVPMRFWMLIVCLTYT
ncbi:hypothetical protein AVEN_231498-1 [Araneus ventricosus]|uniref:Uncharacterized protein n=1 Tax=Araneus ventricosus TaxID=182803 RepID=A0A4Y2U341_ARAVE|nr:hypothetical protein AVEN_231498-1 [Araneus ventricosus]